MYKVKELLLLLYLINLFGCSRSCRELKPEDIVGYYYPFAESKKEYIEIKKNGTYIHIICNDSIHIEDKDKWQIYNGCHVGLSRMRWFNSRFKEYNKFSYADFHWLNGTLELYNEELNFQLENRKPAFQCE